MLLLFIFCIDFKTGIANPLQRNTTSNMVKVVDNEKSEKEGLDGINKLPLAKEYVLWKKYDFNETSDVDPIENSGYFEGDILLDPILGRNAIKNEWFKWPGGRVPYVIPSFFGVRGRIVVALAVSEYSRNTCIRFVKRTNETDYLSLERGNGCSSYIGRIGGQQKVTLATGCDEIGIVLHELMHALGFWHEQSRSDRDDYVTIHWDNIREGMQFNFNKYSTRVQQTLGENYDYISVMHYSSRAFAKDPSRLTIEPKQFGASLIIGQRLGFSSTDIRKINKLYNCDSFLQGNK